MVSRRNFLGAAAATPLIATAGVASAQASGVSGLKSMTTGAKPISAEERHAASPRPSGSWARWGSPP